MTPSRLIHAVKWRYYVARAWLSQLERAVFSWTRPQIRPPIRDFSLQVPFDYIEEDCHKGDRVVAAICHIYYADLIDELRGRLDMIPGKVDLFISTDTAEKAGVIRNAFSHWDKGAIELRLVPNRGRDIAPKLVSFKDVYSRYPLVVFLHTKKTEFAGIGDRWRQTLYQSLVGSRAVVTSILEAFDRDPRLGLIFPQHFEGVRRFVHWGEDFALARRLAARMGVELRASAPFDYPSGSMFWVRPAALAPLLALDFSAEDFPEETGQKDGTLAHAVERLFVYACERAGYDWLKVAAPQMFSQRQTIVPIATPAALRAFKADHALALLSPPAHSGA